MSNLCDVCENDEFENLDGFYYCTQCGTKSLTKQDIELNDEDALASGTVRIDETIKQAKKTRQDNINENELNLDMAYSTFHVFNHVLKAQVDDLVRLGCNKIIKKVVFELWAKYLQKLEIAFKEHDNDEVNESNIKWRRDKDFLEKYKLKIKNNQLATENDSKENEQKDDEEMVQNDEREDDQMVHDEDTVVNQESSDDEIDFESSETVRKSRKILLTKFEWIRMPHTIILLNIGLLITKSNILLTDLIRFVNKGLVSYSNINKILPKEMKFLLKEDNNMFNAHNLPHADYLRYLTGKMGQYLDLSIIEIIDMRNVCCRYIHDLNLPYELNGLINGLIEKINEDSRHKLIPHECDFQNGQNLNIEANAISLIFVLIIVIFLQNESDRDESSEYFSFTQWRLKMQNVLTRIGDFAFGIDSIENVKCIEDLALLNYSNIDFRYNQEAKPFVSLYRNKEILETLALPLEIDNEQERVVIRKSANKDGTLFYISEIMSQHDSTHDMRALRIDRRLLSTKLHYLTKSMKQNRCNDLLLEYLKSFVLTNRQNYYKYSMIGTNGNTINWLMDVFIQISKTVNLSGTLTKIINKII